MPGRGYEGIHFAMEYLGQENLAGGPAADTAAGAAAGGSAGAPADTPPISARGKRVLVIGGGDTGADCVGTAARQGARSIHQVEILPRPRDWAEPANPEWPRWPNVLRSSTSHQEGCTRAWGISVTQFSGGYDPWVQLAHFARVEWQPGRGGRPEPVEVPGTEESLSVELVLLAMGFLHPEHGRLLEDLGVELDTRGNIAVDAGYGTSKEGIFACGDAATGASLVVNAIAHGVQAGLAVTEFLK